MHVSGVASRPLDEQEVARSVSDHLRESIQPPMDIEALADRVTSKLPAPLRADEGVIAGLVADRVEAGLSCLYKKMEAMETRLATYEATPAPPTKPVSHVVLEKPHPILPAPQHMIPNTRNGLSTPSIFDDDPRLDVGVVANPPMAQLSVGSLTVGSSDSHCRRTRVTG